MLKIENSYNFGVLKLSVYMQLEIISLLIFNFKTLKDIKFKKECGSRVCFLFSPVCKVLAL